MALEDAITSAGGIPVMVRTGHSFMKRELRNNPDSPLAGEMSGHFFLNDRWPGFDDSLYHTARLLEIMAREPSPESGGPVFSDWFVDLPNYASTGEAKVPLDRDREETMNFVTNAFIDMKKSIVDGVRVRYPDGWYLCRPSNTEPILVMRAEASNEENLKKIKEDVEYRLGAKINLKKFHES
jgi:phosphomannomutase/phosphoglucomutase